MSRKSREAEAPALQVERKKFSVESKFSKRIVTLGNVGRGGIMRLNVICVALAAMLLAACTGSSDDSISIQYAKDVRRLGIFPVYPPREDIQVGDVYMWSMSEADPNDSVSVYLTTIEWLRHRADEFMKTRIVFNDTIVEGSGGKVQTDLPSSDAKLTTRAENVTLAQSLPIASFPTITADAGLTAGVGFVRALSAIGLTGAARTKVTLNFNDVRTYYVPNAQIRNEAPAYVPSNFGQLFENGTEERQAKVVARRGPGVKACGAGRKCGVSFVTRVYLTRTINYTYVNARILAAAFKSAEAGQSKAQPANAPNLTVNIGLTDKGSIDSEKLVTQIDSLRTLLDTYTSSTNQGVSFSFESWDARGITFSSTYQRPVVVGWDGILFAEH